MPDPREAPVRFEHVSFSYPSRGGLVLDRVDLELEPGETVALTGPSGEASTLDLSHSWPSPTPAT